MQDIKKALEQKKVVIGYNAVVKQLRNKDLSVVIFANNLPELKRKELEKFCKITKISIEDAGMPNDELGIVCKKSFSISVLGIKK